ncbi:MAG: HAD hydrolase family protein [Chlorobi bacterium]|nr:HAD hydrolase family protein [Chlorobiota bacterium]
MTTRNSIPETHQKKLREIRAIFLDVDGVLTDGSIVYTSDGAELKAFHVQDGLGIRLAMEKGLRVGLITGRSSEVVERRARELGITDLYQGSLDKASVLDEIEAVYDLTDEQVAYMGDDILDLPVLRRVGFSAAPANAHPAVLQAVDFVTQKTGGNGAVREMIDYILSARDGAAEV